MDSGEWTTVDWRRSGSGASTPEPETNLALSNSFEALTPLGHEHPEEPDIPERPRQGVSKDQPTSVIEGPETEDLSRTSLTITERMYRMLGRSEEGIAKRSSKIQYKIRLPGKKKKGTKKKKKAAKTKQTSDGKLGENTDQDGTPPLDESAQGPIQRQEESDAEEMDYEEAITGTCPTMDEIFEAEETIVRGEEKPEKGYTHCFLSSEVGSTNPLQELIGSGFGKYPTLAGPVFMTEQAQPTSSATHPSVRAGHYALHNLNEIYQICVYPQLQLYHQEDKSSSMRVFYSILEILSAYSSLIMPAQCRTVRLIVQSGARLMTGAKNNIHFEKQLNQATKGALLVFQHLLDYVALRCYRTTTETVLDRRFGTLATSVKNLIPSDEDSPSRLREDLANDLEGLETSVKVTVHLRVVLLETLHACERLGDSATSGKPSYGTQLLATLPYQTINMLVSMKIIEWSLALQPAELRPEAFVSYLEQAPLQSEASTSAERVESPISQRFPLPPYANLDKLAELIKETRQNKARARQQRIEEEKAAEQLRQQDRERERQLREESTLRDAAGVQQDNPQVEVQSTDTESPSNTSDRVITSGIMPDVYMVVLSEPVIRTYQLLAADPMQFIERLDRMNLLGGHIQGATGASPDVDHQDPRAADNIDPERTEELQPEASNAGKDTASSESATRKRESSLPSGPSRAKHPRLTSIVEQGTETLSTPGQSTTNQQTPAFQATASPDQDPGLEGPISSETAASSPTLQINVELSPESEQDLPMLEDLGRPMQTSDSPSSEAAGADFISLRSILANAEGDPRSSVRNWGPTSKPTHLLRTDYTKGIERDQKRVKLAMDLSAAQSKFPAVYHRDPTPEELSKSRVDEFCRHVRGQLLQKFTSSDLKAALADLPAVQGNYQAYRGYLEAWLPRFLDEAEYTKAPALLLPFFVPEIWLTHHSLDQDVDTAATSQDTVVGSLTGADALALLEKMVSHLSYNHPLTRLQPEVVNSIATVNIRRFHQTSWES